MTAPIDRIDRLFAHNARTLPNDVHLLLPDGGRQTWGQTWSRAARLAAALVAAGVAPGDRVLVMMGNSRELEELYVGCSLAGAICVPVNVLSTAHELARIGEDCSPRAAVIERQYAERFGGFPVGALALRAVTQGALAGWTPYEAVAESGEPLAAARVDDPEQPGIMIYSSGTTGRPKGILLRQRAVVQNAQMTNAVARIRQGDRNLAMLPLYSSFGFCWDFLMPALAGATTAILPRFDPERALAMVEAHRITVLVGVPTMFARIFDAPALASTDVSSLRLMDVGGGPVAQRLKDDLKNVHGIEIIESYGLTEISPVAACQVPFGEHRPGSTGPTLPGVDVKVIDDSGRPLPPGEPGELCFRAPTLMVGYWNQPEQTAQALRDGWLHSGDIGTVDADGHVYIRDRLKDMIVSNGNNVYPKEVENALCMHDAVQSAAVVGVPDEIRGEVIHAFVVLKTGVRATEAELIEHCAGLVGRHKLPRAVSFTEELPLTASGKIQRFQLRARLAETRDGRR